MALGQAAGTAAALSCQKGVSPDELEVDLIQEQLINDGAVLMYFRDIEPENSQFKLLQQAAVLGYFTVNDWEARLGEAVGRETARRWIDLSGIEITTEEAAGMARGEFLRKVFE
jgi:hypothetical protein